MRTYFLDKDGSWKDIRELERRTSRLWLLLCSLLAGIAIVSVLFNLYFFLTR